MRISDWSSDVCSSDLAEGGAFPDPAGDQLEGPRRDLLAGAGDADDDGDAPALVAALERLSHRLDVADALEGIVGAAAGQLDQVADHVLVAQVAGIDDVGHAERLGKRPLLGVGGNDTRSEERRVRKGVGSTVRSRRSPYLKKKKTRL